MKIVDKYVYPKSSRASIAGLRHYTVTGEEQKLPSVTTVLGQTQPKEKQESLDRWRERGGCERTHARGLGLTFQLHDEHGLPVGGSTRRLTRPLF